MIYFVYLLPSSAYDSLQLIQVGIKIQTTLAVSKVLPETAPIFKMSQNILSAKI